MTAITIKATAICPGGNHVTFTVSGAKSLTLIVDLAEMQESITNDDVVAFVKIISKMARSSRTVAQTKTLLQAGVTVTI
jgi:hypothetical protein